jgi:hypothetical protein
MYQYRYTREQLEQDHAEGVGVELDGDGAELEVLGCLWVKNTKQKGSQIS